MAENLAEQVEETAATVARLSSQLQTKGKEEEIRRLREESLAQNFWANDQYAKKVMQRIASLSELIDKVRHIEGLLSDARTAIELEMADEATQKLEEATHHIGSLEEETYFSGAYDHSDAILSVHSGQGGTEAMDWAAMILRMYERFVEKRNWKWELIDEQTGEEAGIKSATLVIHGTKAYGFLKHEKGTHRLVRKSPFNADHLRQTSFALVEVMPVVEENADVVIKPEDIEFEAFRSSGHGGQNVNKVSTAVRLKHIPTGITVSSQSQRYQDQNRKIALQLLRAKLWEVEEQKRGQKLREIKGEHVQASWGTQIRSYVLHPYKLVKDVRTDVESHDPDSVLDGDLDDFITAELRVL